MQISKRSSTAHADELNHSIKAVQPRNQFNPYKSTNRASTAQFGELNCPTQMFKSGPPKHIKLVHVEHREERKKEVKEVKYKKENSLRTRLYMSWGQGPTKKKSIKADTGQIKARIGDQTPEGEADDEEGELASAGVLGSPG